MTFFPSLRTQTPERTQGRPAVPPGRLRPGPPAAGDGARAPADPAVSPP
jgi:hypothetical protein